MSDSRVLLTVYVTDRVAEILRVVAFWENDHKRSTLIAQLIDEALEARGITDIDSFINNKYKR